ncbi:MAG: DUF63 family protein [Candidatus Diapherotrites archaeon]|nr:DUF63 family protein [Candidatus Diapherotrites archaeon]
MDLFGGLVWFLNYYFVRPLFDCSGYNIVNTLGFIVILAIIAIALKRVFEDKDVKFNKKMFWALVPFVFFGGALRALEDLMEAPLGCAARQANPWLLLLITPFIYLVLLVIVLALMLAAMRFSKDWTKTVRNVGIILASLSWLLALVNGKNWVEFFSIIALALIVGGLTVLALKLAKRYSQAGALVVFGQSLDASATALAVGLLGYGEQHVFTNMVVGVSPYLFIPLKAMLAFLVVYAVDKEKSNWKWLFLFLVLMIGLAPGSRDLLRILMGV